MDSKEKISVLFWMAVGLSVSLASIKLKIGQMSNPGAGFMSFYAGLLLILLSLILAISKIGKRRVEHSVPFDLPMSKNIAIILSSLFIFASLFETLGYLTSVSLLLFVLLKMSTPKKWLSPLLWSIGISLSTYVVFYVLLKCNFPQGVFHLG